MKSILCVKICNAGLWLFMLIFMMLVVIVFDEGREIDPQPLLERKADKREIFDGFFEDEVYPDVFF